MQRSERELNDLSETIVAAAQAAAAVVRAGAPTAGAIEWVEKSASDFVSAVDRAAEEAAIATLRERFPEAVIIGEELSPSQAVGSGLTFFVDPLDGTMNFLHGFPAYAVSIAASRDGELLAGTVLNVPHDELFTATRGHGAFRDGEPIRVSALDDAHRALIGTGFPFRTLGDLDTYVRQFELVSRRTAGVRRAGSAALDFADVACGRFDAFWELTLSPWDAAAGILLVREAGGVVTDLDGAPARPVVGGYVAGNPTMHAWLLRTLDEAESD